MLRILGHILAVGWGVVLALALLASLEYLLRINRTTQWFGREFPYRPQHGSPAKMDPRLAGILSGPRFNYIFENRLTPMPPYNPDVHSRAIRKFHPFRPTRDGKVVSPGNYEKTSVDPVTGATNYHMHFVLDEFGRRQVPFKFKKEPTQSILLLGCSFTFGEGVDDHETIAMRLQEHFPKHQVYNFGYPAFGPNDTLAFLQDDSDMRLQGVKQNDGVAFYFYIPSHIKRVNGSVQHLQEDLGYGSMAKFAIVDGQARHMGTFDSHSPLKMAFYRYFSTTAIQQYFNIELPIQTEYHNRLFAKVIEGLRDQVQKRFGIRKLYVVIFPGRGGFSDMWLPYLSSENITVLNYGSIPFSSLLKNNESIQGDSHPTPLAIRVLSDLIVEDLGGIPL